MLASTAAAAAAPAPSHEAWATLLRSRVDPWGRVAYRTIAEKDAGRLADYLRSLAAVDATRLSADDAAAFWINAYNAAVVLAVVRGETPETFEGRARMFEWFEVDVAGASRRLDDLRSMLAGYAEADPRVRLALCDGAVGSPRLSRQPYAGETLEADLDRAARRFVQSPGSVEVDVANRRATLSPIFEWYRRDFERRGRTLAAFLARTLPEGEERRLFAGGEVEIRFGTFDWTLNAAPGERPAGAPSP